MTQFSVRHVGREETATSEMWRKGLVSRCEKPESRAEITAIDRLEGIGQKRPAAPPEHDGRFRRIRSG
jgi:hypothetical protein